MNIILVRHAEVMINNPSVYAHEMKQWIERYDKCDIKEKIYKNELYNIILDKKNIFFISSLQRTHDTLCLYQTFSESDYTINKIFNEAELPYPKQSYILRLPAFFWRIILRLLWIFGYSKHSESFSDAKKRADIASKLLLESAKNNNSNVVLIGHGVINRLIYNRLKRKTRVVKKLSTQNLGYGILEVSK